MPTESQWYTGTLPLDSGIPFPLLCASIAIVISINYVCLLTKIYDYFLIQFSLKHYRRTKNYKQKCIYIIFCTFRLYLPLWPPLPVLLIILSAYKLLSSAI